MHILHSVTEGQKLVPKYFKVNIKEELEGYSILDCRRCSNKLQYLGSWIGVETKHNSRESKTSLNNWVELMNTFDSRCPARRAKDIRGQGQTIERHKLFYHMVFESCLWEAHRFGEGYWALKGG